jgi:hypothetical protein
MRLILAIIEQSKLKCLVLTGIESVEENAIDEGVADDKFLNHVIAMDFSIVNSSSDSD